MSWSLYDTPCFTAEDGTKSPGNEVDLVIVEDLTYQTPQTRAAYDSAENRFTVLLPDSATAPSAWIPRTREAVQEQYGVDSPFDLYPLPGWEA